MTARPPRSKNNAAPTPRPTMRDVARVAGGVHPSTVSLALRNHPGISAATRKRVRAAARKLGYRPDPLLDAFNTHRLEVLPHKALPVIAFIADFESRSAMELSPQHAALWSGARAAAEALHCQIELFLVAKGQLTPERIHSILRARGIVSLILAALRPTTTRLAFEWTNYSAIRIEGSHLNIPLDTVASDRRQSSRLAFRKLKELGYRRIGFTTDLDSTGGGGELSRAGYLLEQSRMTERAAPPIFEIDESARPAVFMEWIRRYQLDAILSDASNLRRLLDAAGCKIPRDLGFAHLDLASSTAESVAGISTDHARVGAHAVEQVSSLLRTNQRGYPVTPCATCVPGVWKDGATAPAK